MAVNNFKDITEMKAAVGRVLGPSEWVLIDQDRIDKFADATGDHQWIHVDVERATKEMPTKSTIAHGYLTLSLLPMMNYELYQLESAVHGINYGGNKLRFLNMVPSGSRVRGHLTLKSVEEHKSGGYQVIGEVSVEIEGAERPALIAETIAVLYEA
jgi:acyl dehydratase